MGNVKVDYLTISISESFDADLRREDASSDTETLESAYERDVFDHGTRSFWIQELGNQEKERGANNTRPIRIEVDMGPGESHTVEIGVYGKQFCNGATFQIEYGCLGSSPEDSMDFFTRRLYLPLLVAVKSAIKVQNPDILLFGKEIKWREDDGVDERVSLSAATGHPLHKREERRYSLEEMMVDPFGFSSEKQSQNHLLIKNIPVDRASEYCLLTFDLKNVWNHLFEVVFEIYEGILFILIQR